MDPRDFIGKHCGTFRVRCACILVLLEATFAIGYGVFCIVIPKPNAIPVYVLLALMSFIELVIVPYMLVSLVKLRRDTGYPYVGVKILVIFLTIGTIALCAFQWHQDDAVDYPYWGELAAEGGLLAFVINSSALYLVVDSRRDLLESENHNTGTVEAQSDLNSAQQPLNK